MFKYLLLDLYHVAAQHEFDNLHSKPHANGVMAMLIRAYVITSLWWSVLDSKSHSFTAINANSNFVNQVRISEKETEVSIPNITPSRDQRLGLKLCGIYITFYGMLAFINKVRRSIIKIHSPALPTQTSLHKCMFTLPDHQLWTKNATD